jgi:putative phosphoribosyl transferase
VDDGLATGASMRAAVAALRQRNPASVIVAIPVAPPDTVAVLKEEADEVICLAMPEPFLAVGRWYRDFSQTSDEYVKSLLESVWSTEFSSANYTEKP